MTKDTKTENPLPSQVTAFGGGGCSAIATSHDAVVVAAATEHHINLFPPCSIWKPSISLQIPEEFGEYNINLQSTVCDNPECLYKKKYTPYKTESKHESKKDKKKGTKGTIQILEFFGENSEYIVGFGLRHFVIYELYKHENKPIICMDSRYFGVELEENPDLRQASLAVFNICRNHLFYKETVSCIDFAFSIRPYVPTYFRVLFNEKKNWWFVDCRWTKGLISKDSLDEYVPYVFYNHDNSERLRRDQEKKQKWRRESPFNQVKGGKTDKETYTLNSTLNMINGDYDKSQNEEKNKSNHVEEEGESKITSDSDQYEMLSSSRFSETTDPNAPGPKMGESDNGSVSNEESEQMESPSDFENMDYFDESRSTSDQGDKDSGLDEGHGQESHIYSSGKVVEKGVYFPFCLLSRKVDLSKEKLKEYATVVKDGFVSYNQDFIMTVFVPIATVVIMEFSIVHKFYIRKGRVRYTKLGSTETTILSDQLLSIINSKAHAFAARKQGNLFSLLFNDRFYVLTYSIPSVVSKVLMNEETEEQEEVLSDDNKREKRPAEDDLAVYTGRLSENGIEISKQNSSEQTLIKRYLNGLQTGGTSTPEESVTPGHPNGLANNFLNSAHKLVNELDSGDRNGINVDVNVNSIDSEDNYNGNMNMDHLNQDDYKDGEDGQNPQGTEEGAENTPEEDGDDKKAEGSPLKENKDLRRFKIYTIEDDTTSSLTVKFCHYDPVLRPRYTSATFDLTTKEGYLAICTNQTTQWGMQFFNTSSKTGIDALTLVLDCSRCKGFLQMCWLPFSNKILVISSNNSELFLIEPKSQKNWVGLISNFTSIDKNIEYIEGEDIFDYSPDNQEIPPSLRELQTQERPKKPREDLQPTKEKRVSLRYPFFHILFSITGLYRLKSPEPISHNLYPLLHRDPPEIRERFSHWVDKLYAP